MLGTSESSGGAKRAKEKEDGGSSSKGKGKVTGKKSFETKWGRSHLKPNDQAIIA